MHDRNDDPSPLVSDGSSSLSEDLANILSRLPDAGVEDDVTRLMDAYESVEQRYRAGVQASAPRVASYGSTNR